MTFIGEQDGKAYRSKATSMFFDAVHNSPENFEKKCSLKKATSSFFTPSQSNPSSEKVVSITNATIKDSSQIKYL